MQTIKDHHKLLKETPRIGLVVWVYSLKQTRALRHYGTLLYVSKKMKYVLLYVDEAQAEATMAKLAKLRFVRHVEQSLKQTLTTSYGPGADTAMNALIKAAKDQPGILDHARH